MNQEPSNDCLVVLPKANIHHFKVWKPKKKKHNAAFSISLQ